MEYKAFLSFTKQIEGRAVTGLAAIFGNLDDQLDIVHSGAFKKTISEQAERVRHLWQHDTRLPPVATVKQLREVGKSDLPEEVKERFPDATGGLLVTREYLETERGSEILAAIKAEPPAIREMSFGYDPVKFDFEQLDSGEKSGALVRNLRELRLWDTSDVNWGANPATVASKSGVPFRDTGKASEDADWNAPRLSDFTSDPFEELSAAERHRIAGHFAWTEAMPPESFGQVKLPHHAVSNSGIGPAVWRGVSVAMSALLGAHGGVDLPASDRLTTYNHLVKHFEQFDCEPPDFKLVELACAVKAATDVALDGDLALAFDGLKLGELVAELHDFLSAAEPASKGSLTDANLLFADYQATLARLRGVSV